MQILPPGSTTTIGKAFSDALAQLEALVADLPEKADPVVIDTPEQYTEVAERWTERKKRKKTASAIIKPFKQLADRVHGTVCGIENKYLGRLDPFVDVDGKAIVEWDDKIEAERKRIETQLREQAEQEERERVETEAATLRERAAKENKPELAERAQAIEEAPPREVNVSVGGYERPKVGGMSVTKNWAVTINDPDALVKAIGKPDTYREIAAWLRKEFGKNGDKLALLLEVKAGTFPQIPPSICTVLQGKVKTQANAQNGKLTWPGVAVYEDKKPKATGR